MTSWSWKRRIEEADRLIAVIREEMEGVYPLRVPLKVDINKGFNWDEAH
jgi:DNA polymerase I-like protein with 3'-5' exonuclease and polymerase domains